MKYIEELRVKQILEGACQEMLEIQKKVAHILLKNGCVYSVYYKYSPSFGWIVPFSYYYMVVSTLTSQEVHQNLFFRGILRFV